MNMLDEGRMVEFNGVQYNARHGGPFDRGSADSYYHRGRNPHYYTGATHQSTRLEAVDMSEKEIADYMAGYAYNEQFGDKKDWG
jgi:hypothetical protein